jgi:ribonuclease E
MENGGNGGIQEIASPAGEAEAVEQVGSEDALEELPSRPRRRPRSYKIQEVTKRRQVILVQVVKEERGNKGAALTTYLSLAGRYTVLMPNTARGGGISRKITNPQDRKRLKAIAAELEVPEGMGLIIRTAGAARTKQEIKRDFEYLLRLWESVRDLTLASTAPSLVYEEGNLIKRSIRDLYNKDVEEIIVAGEHAHKEAKDFMRMLMPSHAKNVVLHQDPEPLFTRFGIERQLNAMFSPYVTLKSGGYLVINQTEALVAIDVNSGKATREFSIEETALNTNLEAADEIARQLKLRDLAGLIVIDFIDMEEKRNNRAVERRLKDALRFDRARIQLGRISHFGLMEMSRQRLRSGVLEGSTSQCPHCQGTGIIRSTESVALAVLRGLEDALMAGARTSLVATTTASVALYILNNKRNFVNDMEARHGIAITVQASDKLQGANFLIEKGHAPQSPVRRPERSAVSMDWGFEGEESDEGEAESARASAEAERRGRAEEGGRDDAGRRRRRRRRRGGRRDEGPREAGDEFGADFAGALADDSSPQPEDLDREDEPERREAAEPGSGSQRRDEAEARRRRRGRRGGRRGRDRGPAPDLGGDEIGRSSEGDRARAAGGPPFEAEPEDMAIRERREPVAAEGVTKASQSPGPMPEMAAPAKPRARSRLTSSEPKLERVVVKPDQAGSGETGEPAETSVGATRRGWWQRRLGSEG